jgi:hypothetical protein
MLKRRIALAGVVIVASLGAAPAAWADNSGPPKPLFSGNERGATVCHAYPGATAETKNGAHGKPNALQCLT